MLKKKTGDRWQNRALMAGSPEANCPFSVTPQTYEQIQGGRDPRNLILSSRFGPQTTRRSNSIGEVRKVQPDKWRLQVLAWVDVIWVEKVAKNRFWKGFNAENVVCVFGEILSCGVNFKNWLIRLFESGNFWLVVFEVE